MTWLDQAKAMGGPFAHLLDIPDVAKTFKWAIDNGVDINTAAGQARFDGQLEKTAWWKKTTSDQRAWDIKVRSISEPDKAKLLSDQKVKIQGIASQLGVSLDPKTLDQFVGYTLRNGYSDQDLQRSLATHIKAQDGQANAVVDGVRAVGRDYGLILTDADVQKWAQQIASGNTTKEQLQSWAVLQAKNAHPTLAAAFDQGFNFKDVTSQYRNTIAQELDIPEDQVNLMAPEWSDVLQQRQKDGTFSPMTLADTRRFARSKPQWQYTSAAKQQAAQVAESLGQVFGRSGL